MTPKEAEDPAWRYWKARALKNVGREAEALAMLKPLSDEYNFYGQLAQEDLGGTVQAPAAAYKPTEQDIAAIAARPGIRRALALFQLDVRLEAVREWLWAIRGLSDRQLLAAAEVARRNSVYDRAINTAVQARDPQAARAAVETHLNYVLASLTEARQSERHEAVARKRLEHESER